MDVPRFRGSPVGSLVPISVPDGRTGDTIKHYAFAAEPLAGTPSLSPETWDRVTRAAHALGRLQQGSQLVPNPSLFRRPTLRREAQSTSALEGTFAPLEEVLAADVIDDSSRSSALNEVLNYIVAAENAFDWLASGRELTVGLMCDLHRTLVAGTSADTEDAGRVRQLQVVIGSRAGSVYDARFIPMPPGPRLESGLSDLLDWIRPGEHNTVNGIVAAAMAHYQFETLHPFNDGNGRLGRLLIVLQIVRLDLLSLGLLSVSPWFEQRRDRYQELLAEVSATGNWDGWVRFFAEGIEVSAADTARRMQQLLALQEEYHEKLRVAGLKGTIRDIADLLIGNPYVTIPFLARHMEKTYPAIKTAVAKLVDLEILSEMTYPGLRRFRADAVVRITLDQ